VEPKLYPDKTLELAPPGQDVRVAASGQLDLISMDELNFKKPTADALFASVASSFGARAIAVVLSGYLSDGAEGSRVIKQLGGIVLVQDPATAEAAGMPSAAIATGCVDSVLPLSSMGAALAGLVRIGRSDLARPRLNFAEAHLCTFKH
jgi:two-component system chemotaxis response regulator CheB